MLSHISLALEEELVLSFHAHFRVREGTSCVVSLNPVVFAFLLPFLGLLFGSLFSL